MPSPKLIQILRSKIELTDEQIIPLSEDEGWKKVYEAEVRAKAEREANRKPQVCFSGFNKKDKESLETLASKKGFESKRSVTKTLNYLVIGETAGEIKIKKAETQGVQILRKNEFEALAKKNE